MLREVLISFVLLSLSTQRCCVYSGGTPGEAVIPNRYNSHIHASADGGGGGGGKIPHLGTHSYHQHQYSTHSGSPHVSASSSVIPGSGHIESKNSYNLLSEAMSQAVSNEFSSLGGSGSADGACHADDLDCYSMQDRLGMEAIRSLHRQLDDDDNGNIDLSESDDFLREELKYDSGYEKRQKAFHYNDDMHISVKELWEAWLRSEVHNWTIEQTTDWLAQSVQLPQYVDLFKVHKVAGATLPRLAVNNMQYVGTVLGIKDPIHKQKIALKAMDVVLFGPPRETGTRWKDYILVTLLLSAIIGCWYAYQQNKNAKRHLRRMAQDMEGLQKAEQSLQEMQKELERARMEQESVTTQKMDLERRLREVPSLASSNSDLEVQQLKKEIEMLRSELSRAEIELVDNCWAPPPQLQSWLQYTYELESKNHLKKRVAAEKQLQSAREACEKLRKKRSSLVGAFVSTHGKSIDDVDRSIVEARNSLGEVTNELQERLHRWKQIEQCLGMTIVSNNGLTYLESVLYGRNNGVGSGGSASLKSSRGRMTSSSDDLDDESVQGFIDGYNRSSGLSNSTIINNSSVNALRDDSSGSEDGSPDRQSVQFYLGNNPPTPIANTNAISPCPAGIASRNLLSSAITAPAPIENHLTCNSTHAAATLNSNSMTSTTNNCNSIQAFNDSNPLLRSQSSELMNKDLYALMTKAQQPQLLHQSLTKINGNIITLAPPKCKKMMMIKQHSTASQQSTSSTSSSVHSAPDLTKGQSPTRISTTSLEKVILPNASAINNTISQTYHHQQHQPFSSLGQPPTSFLCHQILDNEAFDICSSLNNGNLEYIESATNVSPFIEGQLHNSSQLNTTNKTEGGSDSREGNNRLIVKKRKKRLRFGFGSKKSQNQESKIKKEK
ncbi:stromal interaction molecule homolog isoform X3 [Glossina fuscipes]|uniref:Stromal interaction molecule homolog isoform X3 n=1 Tax=Glossina fuscipes TaxID=7396 RepID=A0A9C6DK59_9MUSC|nr:stromal interaction molecule homolog isoform X3 [Glossina fuscipes]